MRLSQIVLKIRASETRFENRVAGAADLAQAMESPLGGDTAFVVQMGENCSKGRDESSINQLVQEVYGVIVALRNDSNYLDKTGLTAYDLLYDVRAELWSSLLGWYVSGAEGLMYYLGGRQIEINRAYLWYVFMFGVDFRIGQDEGVTEEATNWFNTLYAQWEMSPSVNLPYGGNLPVALFDSDMTSIVDLTENPGDGAYAGSYSDAFDLYKSS